MQRLGFRIEGMCCGGEVCVLKKAAAPLVGGAASLGFAILWEAIAADTGTSLLVIFNELRQLKG